ncbi:hypothetical protein DLAC_01960 [Tieghemostelium lacteum]|uniref:Uncharacterized protein n=1 Tax=Tieghemostelium lacteum TaxID=361077 RepID=A0A152A555_TIELA|nr:hypothetical protein DLAC_01960 [Tieghemostelium lacteum]|eukprot:KYR01373.1 hypothetical protein DLAC_01960 [Tieghemostelium lacteum]
MESNFQYLNDFNEACLYTNNNNLNNNINNIEEKDIIVNNSQKFDKDIRTEIVEPPSIINRVTRLFRSKIINKMMGKMDESSVDGEMDDDDGDENEDEEDNSIQQSCSEDDEELLYNDYDSFDDLPEEDKEDPIEKEYMNRVMEKFNELYKSLKHAKKQEEEMDRSLMSQLFWLREIIINHPILSIEDFESQYGELKSVGTQQIKQLIQQCKKSKEQKEFRNTFPIIEYHIKGVIDSNSGCGSNFGGDGNSSGENQYFSLDELCDYTENLKQYINLCLNHREKYLKHQKFYDEGFLKSDLKLDFFKEKNMKISISKDRVYKLKNEMGLSAQQISNIFKIFNIEKEIELLMNNKNDE